MTKTRDSLDYKLKIRLRNLQGIVSGTIRDLETKKIMTTTILEDKKQSKVEFLWAQLVLKSVDLLREALIEAPLKDSVIKEPDEDFRIKFTEEILKSRAENFKSYLEDAAIAGWQDYKEEELRELEKAKKEEPKEELERLYRIIKVLNECMVEMITIYHCEIYKVAVDMSRVLKDSIRVLREKMKELEELDVGETTFTEVKKKTVDYYWKKIDYDIQNHGASMNNFNRVNNDFLRWEIFVRAKIRELEIKIGIKKGEG